MKKTLGLVTLFFALAVLCVVSVTQGEGQSTKGFMRAKLIHSQKVLEGIVNEDFTLVAEQAGQMKLLSLDANWQVIQTVEYTRLSADFRRTADGLIKAAKEKNTDGVVLAHFRLTQNCVDCHRYLRERE